MTELETLLLSERFYSQAEGPEYMEFTIRYILHQLEVTLGPESVVTSDQILYLRFSNSVTSIFV